MSVAFSPDGKIRATGSNDGTARLWDVATGRQIGATLVGHAGAVWSVAFSPDGKTLASGNGNATVQLWDVATGQQTGTLRTTGAVYSVAFSPAGTMLATGSSGGTAQLWDMATGRQIGGLQHRPGLVDLLGGVQPGREDPGHRQATTGQRGYGTSLLTSRSALPLSGATASVSSVTFSPDGQTLAAGSYDGTVRLWDVATKQQIGAALASGDDEPSARWRSARTGISWPPADGNGVVQLWNVRYLTNVVSFLCASAGGSFTPSRVDAVRAGPGIPEDLPVKQPSVPRSGHSAMTKRCRFGRFRGSAPTACQEQRSAQAPDRH